MSKIILKKNGTDYLFGLIPIHYPGDRVYLDGDTTKTVQDKCARKADLTNLDLTGTTNTTGSTIAGGTYFYLNGTLVRAKTNIANGVTFTENTNYEVVTAGGLNKLVETLANYTNRKDTTTYSHIFTRRALNLTFTNGSATYDASAIIGSTNEAIGFAITPYNSYFAGRVTSNNGVLNISFDANMNGSFYVSIVVFYI